MISQAGISLDALLETLAKDTWENLREAKPLSVRFGEETITDTLMLELRRKGFTVFKQTSLRDEAKFGTDFECWVGSDSMGWIGYAIQAKKLDFGTGTYRNLGHVVKGPQKRQLDILTTYAMKRGLTARYCLYSHSMSVNACFLACCSRSFPEEELGCTITHPRAVERAIATPRGKRFHSLQHHRDTVPWRCLAICPRLRSALVANSIPSDDLSPLLDRDSRIHPRLPDDLSGLREETQTGSHAREEGRREVDFEQFGIGVDYREMDYENQLSPSFIIPKRVYILELPGDP